MLQDDVGAEGLHTATAVLYCCICMYVPVAVQVLYVCTGNHGSDGNGSRKSCSAAKQKQASGRCLAAVPVVLLIARIRL